MQFHGELLTFAVNVGTSAGAGAALALLPPTIVMSERAKAIPSISCGGMAVQGSGRAALGASITRDAERPPVVPSRLCLGAVHRSKLPFTVLIDTCFGGWAATSPSDRFCSKPTRSQEGDFGIQAPSGYGMVCKRVLGRFVGNSASVSSPQTPLSRSYPRNSSCNASSSSSFRSISLVEMNLSSCPKNDAASVRGFPAGLRFMGYCC